MPQFGIGTYQVGSESCESLVLHALKTGYRLIDTAEGYNNEAACAAAIAKASEEGIVKPEELFVVSKLWPGNPAWGMPGKDAETAKASCKQSVEKFGGRPIDLYLIHGPFGGPKEVRLAQWQALLDCKKEGLCKFVGVSNFGLHHLAEIEEAKLEMPSVNQLELHPLGQKRELLAYMQKEGIHPMAYSSLAPLQSWRADYTSFKGSKLDEHTEKAATVIEEIAARMKCTPSQVLLKYGLQQGWVLIPKSKREERIAENFNALKVADLLADDIAALNALEQNGAYAFGQAKGEFFDPTTMVP
jgi:2,5-diketo-D-gluconate reductase A